MSVMKRLSIPFAIIACAAVALGASFKPARAQSAPPIPSAQATYVPTVAPTPVPPPGALPSPAGNTATITLHGKAKATPAPPKDPEDNRVGLTGVWEIALQKTDGVVYTHFKLAQSGNTLTGQYLDESGKKFPLAGTIDGKNVRLVVTLADGKALIFNGAQENNTDMVGTLSTAKEIVGFTAGYRPKYKWIDNIAPGGSGGLGGGNGVP